MAKSGLNVNHYTIRPRLTWVDDANRLADLLGGEAEYYAWSSTLPGYVIMTNDLYHAAIKARLAEVEQPDIIGEAEVYRGLVVDAHVSVS